MPLIVCPLVGEQISTSMVLPFRVWSQKNPVGAAVVGTSTNAFVSEA
jgi:hypothetical protein